MQDRILPGVLVLILALTAGAVERPLFTATPGARNPTLPPNAVRAESILVNAGVLCEHGPDPITVEAFGTRLELTRQRIERRSATNWTWFGKVDGDPFGDVILLVDRGEVAGGIHAAGINWWVRSDGLVCEMREEPFGNADDAVEPPPYPLTLPQSTDRTAMTTTINILYLYTQLAETNAPTYWGTNILNVCQLATNYANQACVNSAAALNYANVGQIKYASYTEIGNAEAEAHRLDTIPDGYFDDILEQKDTYAADVAALVLGTPGSAAYGGFMSIVSQAFAPFACSAYPINRVLAGVGGVVAHEVGHNLGLMHDWYVDPGTQPYIYAHGYYKVEGAFRCLMAYPDGCPTCSTILYYSNPLVPYNGYPTGLAEGADPHPADCVRALGNTAPVGATWRDYLDTCTYSLSEYSYTATYQAGSRSVVVNATNGCRWSAASDAGWLTITMPAGSVGNTHQGSGTCQFNYTENVGSQRVAHVTITPMNGGKPTLTYTLTQNAYTANCSSTLNPPSGPIYPASGGSGSFAATLSSQSCAWTATATAPWITDLTPSSGTGNATISYTVLANPTTMDRTGYIYVNSGSSQSQFLIGQWAGQPVCPVTLSPPSAAYNAAGGGGSITVTTGTSCSYSASTLASWIHITSGGTGGNGGTVQYTVDANASSSGRAESIYVATSDGGASCWITQNGAGQICNYNVGPFTQSWPDDGGNTAVTVTTGSGCAWAAWSTGAEWIGFAPATASGSASTVMTIAPNLGAARSGLVTIAGYPYTINQEAYSPGPSGPSITSVTSKQGKPGKPAVINGSGFSATKTANTVKFGKYAATVTKATTTKITATIPTKCKSGKTYAVQVTVSGKKSNTVQFKVK
ncbi:MAG: BACON domain-containing carbohydrate-binding protein [Acidobacteriota bacterium]